jgi:hypothetical protein
MEGTYCAMPKHVHSAGSWSHHYRNLQKKLVALFQAAKRRLYRARQAGTDCGRRGQKADKHTRGPRCSFQDRRDAPGAPRRARYQAAPRRLGVWVGPSRRRDQKSNTNRDQKANKHTRSPDALRRQPTGALRGVEAQTLSVCEGGRIRHDGSALPRPPGAPKARDSISCALRTARPWRPARC